MVVVTLTAEAIADLARPVHEGVNNPVLAQEPERAIDGGEPDSLAAPAQGLIDLLGGRVVRLST